MITLLNHYWKERFRAFRGGKSWYVLIFTTLITLYFGANFLILGIFSDTIIQELFPNQSVIEKHFQFLFYYWMCDIFVRFKFQEVRILQIKPYTTLPVARSLLDRFPLMISLTSNFNYAYLLLVVPFYFNYVLPNESVLFSVIWWLYILSGLVFVSFTSLHLRLYFQKKPLFGFVFLLLLIGFIFLETNKIVHLSSIFWSVIKYAQLYFFPVLLFPLISVISYFMGLRFLRNLKYYEFETNHLNLGVGKLSFLDRWGELGDHIRLDIKFLYRNKRTRAALVSLAFFPVWYYIMITPKLDLTSSKHVFAGIFTISQLCISYGQFVFAGHSTYFDGLITQRISVAHFIRAKYVLFILSMFLIYIVMLPFYFYHPFLPFINLSLLVFSMGTMPYLVLIVACYRYQRFEITQKSSFNYQGFSFLSIVPAAVVCILSILLFNTFSLFNCKEYAYYSYFGIGLIGVFTQKWWLESITRKFKEKKYQLLEGFREK